jgi:hypothetical protein
MYQLTVIKSNGGFSINPYFVTSHEAKSIAGKEFHQDEVKSVEVLSVEKNEIIFSLAKTSNGVTRSEVK